MNYCAGLLPFWSKVCAYLLCNVTVILFWIIPVLMSCFFKDFSHSVFSMHMLRSLLCEYKLHVSNNKKYNLCRRRATLLLPPFCPFRFFVSFYLKVHIFIATIKRKEEMKSWLGCFSACTKKYRQHFRKQTFKRLFSSLI